MFARIVDAVLIVALVGSAKTVKVSMGVKNSERCEVVFDYDKSIKEDWDFYCRKGVVKTRRRNKAVIEFGSRMFVCKECYSYMEEGYQKSLTELD